MKLYMFRAVPLSINRSLFTPDDGQRNCPKTCRVSWQNKFAKLVHLVGFIIKKFIMMHGHMNIKMYKKIKIWAQEYCLHHAVGNTLR
jgi:hypothetical protein